VKWLRRTFFTWALLCIPSLFGFRGCGTAPLVEYSRHADPPITQIHAAYHKDDSVIIDYSVAGRTEKDYSIPPGRYWARFQFDRAGRNMGEQYEIHRQPIAPSVTDGWRGVDVIDLRERITPAADGNYKTADIAPILQAIADGRLPVVTYMLKPRGTDSLPVLNDNFFSIVYLDPRDGKRRSISEEPYATYIPLKNRIRMIYMWPFSVLIDWVCLPVYFLAPRIDG
jgi:hypothetical protein